MTTFITIHRAIDLRLSHLNQDRSSEAMTGLLYIDDKYAILVFSLFSKRHAEVCAANVKTPSSSLNILYLVKTMPSLLATGAAESLEKSYTN